MLASFNRDVDTINYDPVLSSVLVVIFAVLHAFIAFVDMNSDVYLAMCELAIAYACKPIY